MANQHPAFLLFLCFMFNAEITTNQQNGYMNSFIFTIDVLN